VYIYYIYIIYRSGQKRAVKWYGDGEGQWCEMVQLMRTNTSLYMQAVRETEELGRRRGVRQRSS
jgi:hypothetical protein